MNKKEMTIIRGLNGLIAVYKAARLVYTASKHDTTEDLERSIKAHGGDEMKVKEVCSDFSCFEDIPENLSDVSINKVEKEED